MSDARRPEDKLPARPQSARTRTDVDLAEAETRARTPVPAGPAIDGASREAEPRRPPLPPLPPERTTVSAPMLTADESAESSILFSDLAGDVLPAPHTVHDGDGDEGDCGDGDSDEGDSDEAAGFLGGATVAEVAGLDEPGPEIGAAERTVVALVAERTIVAPMDLEALRDPPRTAALPDAGGDDAGDDDGDDVVGGGGVDFDAPTSANPSSAATQTVERTAKIDLRTASSADLGDGPIQQTEVVMAAEVTAPDAPRPGGLMPPLGVLIAFGTASLLLLVLVAAYACGGLGR